MNSSFLYHAWGLYSLECTREEYLHIKEEYLHGTTVIYQLTPVRDKK